MAAKVKPIPDGFHTVTPYLIADGADKLIDFMKNAFGAQYDHEPAKRPDGKIMHTTLKIGNSMLMVSESSEHAKRPRLSCSISMCPTSTPPIRRRSRPVQPR
jgi:PhnB protein